MKNIYKLVIAVIAIELLITLSVVYFKKKEPEPVEVVQVDPLTHRQRVWLGALEWCESQGHTSAVNPNDNDGTPSYYSFQFKPGTYRGFGERYGLVAENLTEKEILAQMTDYKLTVAIMERMLTDKSISTKEWRRQFPGCIAKLGLPPDLSTHSKN